MLPVTRRSSACHGESTHQEREHGVVSVLQSTGVRSEVDRGRILVSCRSDLSALAPGACCMAAHAPRSVFARDRCSLRHPARLAVIRDVDVHCHWQCHDHSRDACGIAMIARARIRARSPLESRRILIQLVFRGGLGAETVAIKQRRNRVCFDWLQAQCREECPREVQRTYPAVSEMHATDPYI